MNCRFGMRAEAVTCVQRADVANCGLNAPARRVTGRSTVVVRVTRERVFGCLALLALIFAWDATLRLDERALLPQGVLTAED
jgi:hypothetical protein